MCLGWAQAVPNCGTCMVVVHLLQLNGRAQPAQGRCPGLIHCGCQYFHFSLFTTVFIFISNVRQDVLSIILYCDTPKFIVDQCTVPLTYRCCAVLQPKYCCGDYNCGHRYYCTYCWISGWGFSVPLHQLPSTTDLQALPILPPTAEGGVSLQSTTTNWSRVWGSSWTETQQVLWNL